LRVGSYTAGTLQKQGLATIYTGIGYRYLNDQANVMPGGYLRESNYIYLPAGCQLDDIKINDNWNLGIEAEFDLLLWGMQETYLSDYLFILDDTNHEQNQGYGYRGSLEFKQKSKNGIFIIKPFIRYWEIEESESEHAGFGIFVVEPDNETTEAGIQFIWMF
jgi:hypothetical protein